MANIKSAKKRILVTQTRTERNKAAKSRVKTFVKKVYAAIDAGDKSAADAALKDAIPYNNKFITVAKSGTSVVLTASMFGMEFDGIKLEKLVDGSCDGCTFDKYEPVEVTVTQTATKVPFGTGEKLFENYRFPTYSNVRYASLGSDEAPIPGAIYTMYSFSYDSPRPGFGGLSGVGQKVDAVTRHIYWVKSDVVSDFEAALTELGITPTTPSE